MDAAVTPNIIDITGPRSIVNTISSIRVRVDLEDVTDSFTTTGEPRVYDGNNIDITNRLNLSFNEVTVAIPVYIQGFIHLNAESIGELPQDHELIRLFSEISYIEVMGPRDEIEEHNVINLPAVDLTGATESFSVLYDLNALLSHTNISIVEPYPNETTVSVQIERYITRVLQIPYINLIIEGMEPNVSIYYIPDYISATVKGLRNRIDNLSSDELTGAINLSGLTEGEYDIRVNLTLPQGVFLEGREPAITVILIELDEDDEDSEDDEDDGREEHELYEDENEEYNNEPEQDPDES